MAVGIAVLVTNAVAAGWGAVGWLRHEARAALAFWPLLRAAQATVVVQAVWACCCWPAERPRRTACT
jgi:hypothetical protein